MSVQTVLGAIDPKDLGVTLTHEHLSLDFAKVYTPGPDKLNKVIDNGITLDNVGFVRQYPYANKLNLQFNGECSNKAVVKDVKIFKEHGGRTIVENTIQGISRDLKFIYECAKETGVNIVAGTGFYVESTQRPDVLKYTTEQMTNTYITEILNGVQVSTKHGDVTIKCGVIGEVGSSYPITPFERRAIEATALAQQSLKCGVIFHPGRAKPAPFEVIRYYLEAGGDATKCVMSHLDRTLIHDEEQLFDFAKLGVYNEFDLFGMECSFYQLCPLFDMPSDGQRMNMLIKLVEEGYGNRLMMAHDIHTLHRLTSFGGHGYSHILTNVLPRMKLKGLTQDQIDQIVIKNPADWLTIQN